MHIADAVLSSTNGYGGTLLIVSGWAGAIAGVGFALRRLDERHVPMVAMLSSAFFIASLVSFPTVVGGRVHLLLCGLLGITLGWQIFPAVFVALILQYFFFGYGGITTLGLNTLVMATPGLICYYLFRRGVCSQSKFVCCLSSSLAAITGVLIAMLLYVTCFLVTNSNVMMIAKASVFFHLPVLVIEAIVTPAIVFSIKKLRPVFFDHCVNQSGTQFL